MFKNHILRRPKHSLGIGHSFRLRPFLFVQAICVSLSRRAAETLASLQVYCHWLSQLHLHSQVHKQYENEFVSIVSSCIDAVIPLLHEEVCYCNVYCN